MSRSPKPGNNPFQIPYVSLYLVRRYNFFGYSNFSLVYLGQIDPKLFLCFTAVSLLRRFFLIFPSLVACKNKAMSATFPGQKFH